MSEKKWWNEFFDPDLYGDTLENLSAGRTEEEVNFVLSCLGIKPGAWVLDLCCGVGRHSVEIAKYGFKVSGLDITEAYLERARKFAQQAEVEVEFVKGDMRRIPWKSRFDAVINLFSSIGYFPSDSENFKVLSAVAKSLKKDGLFLLETMNRDWIVKNFQDRTWDEIGDCLILQENSFDTTTDVSSCRWIFIRDTSRTEGITEVKLYSFSTIKKEMERRGLEVIEQYGDYDGSEYDFESGRMIIVAKKK